jgi:hypothetical protein
MSVWNKVLLGLIGVVAVVLFYMAARALETQRYWRDLARNLEAKIEQTQKENLVLAEGADGEGDQKQLGIRQVGMELFKLQLDRRRVWFNCDPKTSIKVGHDDGTAEITLTIDNPAPNGTAAAKPDIAAKHGIAVKTVLYVFQDIDVQKKGAYLGEFVATKVADKQVTIVPTDKLTSREIDRLEKAQKIPQILVLYEILPRDNHEIFAGMSDEQKKAMLPPDSLHEYLKDGRPAEKDDPKNCVVDGKFVRPLRDYRVLLDADRERYVLLTNSFATAAKDKKLIDDALADAQKQEEACKKDIADSTSDLEKFSRERDVVAAYRDAIKESLASAEAAITRLIDTNKAMAGQIAKFQLEAARRIDQRTRAMAQSGAGRQ